MRAIDLRSDTVTRPSLGMLEAMSKAEVGDDVWGDDPTVNKLQATVAERAGKEAGLFFPSGTQCNLAALMAHCERGDEYLVGQKAHTYIHEGGGAAVLGSIQPQPLENAADGSIPLDLLASAIKPPDDHYARTRLLALENTINGLVLSADYVAKATQLAKSRRLATHLDGARAFNAVVASGATLKDIAGPFDTVSICFSKGLGAPVGSVLVGSKAVLAKARRWRKTLGGGMRQSGVLAAACLYALEHNVERLAEDHANAARLAAALRKIPPLKVTSQATNMVFVNVPPEHCAKLEAHLRKQDIIAFISPETRLVMHLDVSAADVDRVVEAMNGYFEKSLK